MKNTVKKIGLVMALTMVISASILPQISYAGKATKSQTKKTSITTSKNAKGNKTKKEKKKKKILVIKNNKSKTKAITYPDVRKNDNAITYPDVKKKDNAITYPDVKKKDNAITYPDVRKNDNAITYPDVRKNDNAITYPEFLCPMGVLPEILDEDEAYDYLFDVLSGIKKYNMKKHVLEVEDWLNSESDEEPTKWYFSYGTDIDGEFFPTKYFAVNEDGDIFEYNFEEETWYLLAIPYLK